MESPQQRMIAQEGWPLVGGLAVAAALLSWFGAIALAVPIWVMVLGTAYLFRDPPRRVPASPLGVLSPVDGVINAVDEVQDPCLDRQAIRIRICMSIRDIYRVRAPIEGKIVQRWQAKLIGNRCENGDSNDEFDDYGLWLQSDEKDDVVLVVPGGLPFRYPRLYAFAGDRAGQGQRCGFIRFGSRVDLLLPTSSRITVAVGQRVHSGETALATLVHGKDIESPLHQV